MIQGHLFFAVAGILVAGAIWWLVVRYCKPGAGHKGRSDGAIARPRAPRRRRPP